MKTTHHILIVKQSGSCTLTISHHMNIQFNLLWNKKAQWFSAFYFFSGTIFSGGWTHVSCSRDYLDTHAMPLAENIHCWFGCAHGICWQEGKYWIYSDLQSLNQEGWGMTNIWKHGSARVFALSVSSWTGSGPRWDPSQRRSDVMLTRPFSLFERKQRLYVECKCL